MFSIDTVDVDGLDGGYLDTSETKNFQKIRSIREISHYNTLNRNNLLSIIDKLKSRYKNEELLYDCFLDLMNIDSSLRLLLVVLISFPQTDRKTTLSQDISQNRDLCVKTQCRIQALLSVIVGTQEKSGKNSKLFSLFSEVSSSVLKTNDGYTGILRYGYDGMTPFTYTQCHPISINKYRPSCCFSLICSPFNDSLSFKVGVSTAKNVYGLGINSSSISYSCSDITQDSMYSVCITVLLASSYLPSVWNKLYYQPIQNILSDKKLTIGWMVNRLVIQGKAFNHIPENFVQNLILFLSKVLVLSNKRVQLLNSYITHSIQNKSFYIEICLIDFILNQSDFDINIDLLRLRLIFIAKNLSLSDLYLFVNKTDKVLSTIVKTKSK